MTVSEGSDAIDVASRTAAASLAPLTWHYVGASGEPPFLNSWRNSGGGEGVVRYAKDAMGFVHLEGNAAAGTLGAVGFQLPVGFRPLQRTNLMINAGASGTGPPNTSGTVVIDLSGNVIFFQAGGNAYFNLYNISFYAGVDTDASGFGIGGLTKIAEATLTANGSFSFPDIPQSYQALQIMGSVKNTVDSRVRMAVNGGGRVGDWDNRSTFAQWPGTLVHGAEADETTAFLGNCTAADFADFVGIMLDYSQIKPRRLRTHNSGGADNASYIQDIASYYNGSPFNAVTSLSIAPAAGSFIAGSSVAIYGVGGGVTAQLGLKPTWVAVGSTGAAAYQGSWQAEFGNILAYSKDAMGLARLRGKMRLGTAAEVFVLPVGYRPANDEDFIAMSYNGSVQAPCQLKIGADGQVRVIGANGTTFVYVGSPTWSAVQ